MLSLRHPYISVSLNGRVSYGGSQMLATNDMVKRCGCGIVAALDLLLYLERWHGGGYVPMFASLPADGPIPFPAYNSCVDRLRKTYFPMIPYAGINGVMLAAGMQLFLKRHAMPWKARWCFSSSAIWARIGTMLQEDLPVIMSVGPNFPDFWGKEKASFYTQTPYGEYRRASAAHAHYFTVTGMDDEWLRISSWGQCYYLNRQEFEQYARRHSAGFLCNILYLEKCG